MPNAYHMSKVIYCLPNMSDQACWTLKTRALQVMLMEHNELDKSEAGHVKNLDSGSC